MASEELGRTHEEGALQSQLEEAAHHEEEAFATAAPAEVHSSLAVDAQEDQGNNKEIDEEELGLSALEITTLEVIEERLDRVLKENADMCAEIPLLAAKLAEAKKSDEELVADLAAQQSFNHRDKVVMQSLIRNAQHTTRSELQHANEVARHMLDLKEVHTQLQRGERQLEFALQLQEETIRDLENKVSARSRRIRKLELCLYSLVAQAQRDERLDGRVPGLVARCGPLVHGVLAREAQRQAAEIISIEGQQN